MSILLVPGQVPLSALQAIYETGAVPRLDEASLQRIQASADRIATIVGSGEAHYGINTGFGKLASVRIPTEDVDKLQRNLILSHCCGVGEPLADDIVRLIMALKLISLGRGASGVRPQVVHVLSAMLEKNVLPVIPGKGSVGASGDLAPLAHMTAAMIGEGQVRFEGQVMPAARALERAGIPPVTLSAKEGLALINGTQTSTALALAGLFRAHRALVASVVAGALATDATMASTAPFHPEIHALRGHKGQIDVAAALTQLMTGSQIRDSHRDNDERVQDPYCLRCQPQVAGACLDLIRQVAQSLVVEANAATDNPLVLSDGTVVSGGNFHAEPVAFAADQLAIAVCELGAIAQRRIALMVDPNLSYGLPAFLSPTPGLNSGFMIAEVTSAALMSENKQMAHPASVDSTPTSANQEDHVSMACHGARRLLQMTDNLFSIIGIELLCAAQGVDLRRPLATSPQLDTVHRLVRQSVPALQNDRYMAGDLEMGTQLIASGRVGGAASPAITAALAL